MTSITNKFLKKLITDDLFPYYGKSAARVNGQRTRKERGKCMATERNEGKSVSKPVTVLAAALILTAAFVFIATADDTGTYDTALSGFDGLSDNVAIAFYDETPYGTPEWPWFFVGVLIGLLAALVIWRVWHKGGE